MNAVHGCISLRFVLSRVIRCWCQAVVPIGFVGCRLTWYAVIIVIAVLLDLFSWK